MLGPDLDPVAGPEPEDEPAARELIHRRGRHRDGGGGPNVHAADGGPEPDAAGPECAGREDCELVAAMPLGDPHRFVSERFGPLRAVDNFRCGEPA